MKRRKTTQMVMVGLLALSTFIICGALAAIMWQVLSKGMPVISADFLLKPTTNSGRSGGIFSSIVGTFYVTAVSLLVSVPLGVGAAVYLTEYASEGWLVEWIRFAVSSLAGIPSIVFGLFGFTFFVIQMRMGWSVLSGGLTMGLMILPWLVRIAEEAIKAVPCEYLEGSLALGAPRWKAVFGLVVPAAYPGILSGILLGIGRAFGETAALILTAGSAYHTPTSIWHPARTMAVHLYILSSEGLSLERAYGTAAVLSASILAINALASRLTRAIRTR
ncbi:MAG: phosphate ABC transporter permease PstA [Firmicutes bacterium]|nr:phosphate ABC transporter permease PstA [Bacillota bacterium]